MQIPLADGLNDKVAIVTGGSRGIGEAIARTLARDGAHVVGLDIPPQAADLEKLAGAEQKLNSHKALSGKLQSASKTLNKVKIDDKGLDALRELDRTLVLARQKRDLAATQVVVTDELREALEERTETGLLDLALQLVAGFGFVATDLVFGGYGAVGDADQQCIKCHLDDGFQSFHV